MIQDRIYGLVLSAGLSCRMVEFKPLLNYKNKSFIQNIVLKLSSVCSKIIVVTGYRANEVEKNVSELIVHSTVEFVFNRKYEKEMFTSLQTGLQKASNCDWVIYHFVDQPGLPEKFYTNFVNQVDDEHNWVQPVIRMQKGHPILLHKDLFDHIISADDDTNLREFSKHSFVKKKFWECDYKEVFQDINTEEDLVDLE